MRTVGRIGGLSLALGVFLAVPAGAQNLVPNPNFDTELSPWITAGSGSATFSTKDFTNSPNSGSGHLVVSPADPHTSSGLYSPCSPIPAGATFSAGGSFFIPSGQSRTASPEVLIWWYSDTACAPSKILTVSRGDAPPVLDSWISVVKSGVAPPAGSHRYLISLNFEKIEAGGSVEGYVDNAFFSPGSAQAPCVVDASTICLHGGRFSVKAAWRSTSDDGIGSGLKLNDDTGYFYFFSPNNTEVIVKVVSACVDPFDSYWVFAAGLTNVEVTITVTDTQTGAVRTYVNPLNTPFAPIQDTSAFATCP